MTKQLTADEFLAQGKRKNNALVEENAKLKAQLAEARILAERLTKMRHHISQEEYRAIQDAFDILLEATK